MVFAENKQILEILKPFNSITEKIFTRENPSPCSSVMFFDYPADKKPLKIFSVKHLRKVFTL